MRYCFKKKRLEEKRGEVGGSEQGWGGGGRGGETITKMKSDLSISVLCAGTEHELETNCAGPKPMLLQSNPGWRT